MRVAVKRLLAFLVFASCAAALRGQTIQIKLVNGTTGNPITDASEMKVWVGQDGAVMEMRTDKQGVVSLRLTSNDSEMNVPDCTDMRADWKKLPEKPSRAEKKEFEKKYKYCGFGLPLKVAHPIVKYDESISIQSPGDISFIHGNAAYPVGYIPCWVDLQKNKEPQWTLAHFSTKDVLQQGVVTANTCGKASVSPKPGEIILFVRLRTTMEYWRDGWRDLLYID
jgi:hypothetical protein